MIDTQTGNKQRTDTYSRRFKNYCSYARKRCWSGLCQTLGIFSADGATGTRLGCRTGRYSSPRVCPSNLDNVCTMRCPVGIRNPLEKRISRALPDSRAEVFVTTRQLGQYQGGQPILFSAEVEWGMVEFRYFVNAGMQFKGQRVGFSEIHSRHRNLFWRADPHFDVGDAFSTGYLPRRT
ncbi:hypothetical protein MGG_17499 [Pyricularia oryzae 70-15]|uniref:Uncharacterized protein n=1 Tax=Pyricularia oryzae (strain 70-15 / ATCC MYA-4617 / FGSC 8958) TaxID=242507 RepID=G4NDL3_PYRO7|nr:uncharacterized protein MGG_17499 [Pyricularia oryzae 70-15]EHA49298.1 hypothetical protein MGG_17499 [Pyricularia oryzae 70-15]